MNDKTLTIRYGRIGDKGQTQTKDFPSHDKALAEANKKLDEKRRKGDAAAVMGVRQKRAVTRREIVSQVAAKNVTKAPVIWKFNPAGSRAFGIFIDDARCWLDRLIRYPCNRGRSGSRWNLVERLGIKW